MSDKELNKLIGKVVKVAKNTTHHEFEIGEKVVILDWSREIYGIDFLCKSDCKSSKWYLRRDEFTIIEDQQSLISETLTKRELIAAMVLQGLLANGMTTQEGVEPPYYMGTERLVDYCVQLTDALLTKLSKDVVES